MLSVTSPHLDTDFSETALAVSRPHAPFVFQSEPDVRIMADMIRTGLGSLMACTFEETLKDSARRGWQRNVRRRDLASRLTSLLIGLAALNGCNAEPPPQEAGSLVDSIIEDSQREVGPSDASTSDGGARDVSLADSDAEIQDDTESEEADSHGDDIRPSDVVHGDATDTTCELVLRNCPCETEGELCCWFDLLTPLRPTGVCVAGLWHPNGALYCSEEPHPDAPEGSWWYDPEALDCATIGVSGQ